MNLLKLSKALTKKGIAHIVSKESIVALEEGYDEFVKKMDEKLTKFKKGSAWWKPGKNLAINMTILGKVNLWNFTILPLFPKKTAFSKEDNSIVIHPIWTSHYKYKDTYTVNEDVADVFIKAVSSIPDITKTVKGELEWIEKQFKIKINSKVKTKIINESVKVAARRWGVDRLKIKNDLINIDTGETSKQSSW